jgi:predicted membrane-bound mannosyltransferase
MWSRAKEQEQEGSVLPKLAGHVGLFTAVVLIFYAPFLQNGMAIFEGLKTYSTHWQSNDSIFALLLVFYRDGLALQSNTGMWVSTDMPTFFAKATVVLVLIATLIYLMWQKHRKEQTPTDDIFNMFIMMALVFLLSPVQNPWYLCWVIPFLCIFPHRAWLLLTWLVGLYYLDFYFDYQEIQQYSAWIPWFEYPPFYLLLLWDYWKTKNEKP